MSKTVDNQDTSYRALNEELESVLTELQNENLDIDKALEYYQRGLLLIKKLEQYLKASENRMKELKTGDLS